MEPARWNDGLSSVALCASCCVVTRLEVAFRQGSEVQVSWQRPESETVRVGRNSESVCNRVTGYNRMSGKLSVEQAELISECRLSIYLAAKMDMFSEKLL